MRRKIEADRARPRTTARWVTLITLGVVALGALNGTYIRPYGDSLGQLVLAALALGVRRRPGLDAGHQRRHTRATVPARPRRGEDPMSLPETTQLLIAAGALAGLGATVVIRELLPSHPDLADALDRLHPDPARPRPAGGTSTPRPGDGVAGTGWLDRLGLRAARRSPTATGCRSRPGTWTCWTSRCRDSSSPRPGSACWGWCSRTCW